MEHFVSAMWICIELISQFFLLKAILPTKLSRHKIVFSLLIPGIIIFVISNCSVYPFCVNAYLRKFTNLIVVVLWSFVLFGGTWYSHIFTVVLCYFALGVMDTISLYGTSAVLGIALSELVWRKKLYCVVVTVGKLLFLFFAWIFNYIKVKALTQRLSQKKLILVCLFPLVSIFALFSLFIGLKSESDLSTPVALFSIFLAMSNIVILHLISSIDRATKAEHELIILNQSMTLQTENIRALEKSYRAQRSATHEFKHRLQVLYDLDNIWEKRHYVLNEEMIKTVIVHKNINLLDSFEGKPYSTLVALGYSALLKYVQDNIAFFVDKIVFSHSGLSDSPEDTVDMLIRLAGKSALQVKLVEQESFHLDSIVDCAGEHVRTNKDEWMPVWDKLLEKNAVQVSWENVLGYWEIYQFSEALKP